MCNGAIIAVFGLASALPSVPVLVIATMVTKPATLELTVRSNLTELPDIGLLRNYTFRYLDVVILTGARC